MTYNVFGGTLSFTQSINHLCTALMKMSEYPFVYRVCDTQEG